MIRLIEGVLIGLVLARLGYVEYILWKVRESDCDCEHKPGCPYAE